MAPDEFDFHAGYSNLPHAPTQIFLHAVQPGPTITHVASRIAPVEPRQWTNHHFSPANR